MPFFSDYHQTKIQKTLRFFSISCWRGILDTYPTVQTIGQVAIYLFHDLGQFIYISVPYILSCKIVIILLLHRISLKIKTYIKFIYKHNLYKYLIYISYYIYLHIMYIVYVFKLYIILHVTYNRCYYMKKLHITIIVLRNILHTCF